jgi:hypothetical protein
MLKIVFGILLIVQSAFALYPQIDIQGLTGYYSHPKGSASALNASYKIPPVTISHKAITVEIKKETEEVEINDGTTSVAIDLNLAFLDVLKQFDFHETHIKSSKRMFKIDADRLKLNLGSKDFSIQEFSLGSNIENRTISNDDITMLDGFLLEGEISAKLIDFQGITSKEFFQYLYDENQTEESRGPSDVEKMIPLLIRNASASFKDGAIKIYAKMDSWINAGLYINGTANVDWKKSTLSIDIQRAKFGYFSIKKLLLKQIRRLNISNVQVDGAKIVISFNNLQMGQLIAN